MEEKEEEDEDSPLTGGVSTSEADGPADGPTESPAAAKVAVGEEVEAAADGSRPSLLTMITSSPSSSLIGMLAIVGR